MRERLQQILNLSAEISVKGQDVLRMAEVLSLLQQEIKGHENLKEEKK